MTEEEVMANYHVTQNVLYEYRKWGLGDSVKLGIDDARYTDTDIERLSDMMALGEMGFTNDEVKAFMMLSLKGDATKKERMTLLNHQREKILDEIHFRERQIERMDYLRNQIRN